MPRNVLNFLVDFVTLVVMLGMLATGLLTRYVLPPGSRGGQGLSLWGLDRHEWGDIHFWLALALLALLVLHVALHWEWVCGVLRIQILGRAEAGRKPSATRRNVLGAGFLLLLAAAVGGAMWIAAGGVVADPADGEHRGAKGGGRGAAGDLQVSGGMTLGEVAAAAAVDVDDLKAAVGLPAEVAASERLGQLRRQYGLEIESVREAVALLRGFDARGP